MKGDSVKFWNQHLVDFVVQNMAVPRHAVGNHHESRAVLNQMSGLQGMHAESTRSVAFFIRFGQGFHIK